MKRYMQVALMVIVLMGSSIAAFAGDVQTDYDHTVNFSQYNTYSWGKVQTTNPFFVRHSAGSRSTPAGQGMEVDALGRCGHGIRYRRCS